MKLRPTILGLTALTLLAVAAVHSQSTPSAPSIAGLCEPDVRLLHRVVGHAIKRFQSPEEDVFETICGR
jgi:hypothetical protein